MISGSLALVHALQTRANDAPQEQGENMRNRMCCVSLITLLGCGPQQPDAAAVKASAPRLGKADGGDKADRSCQIVLRSVDRKAGNNGYLTKCTAAGCSWIWRGSVEVATGIKGATVKVLYHRVGDPTWWQVTATPASWSQPGFKRYDFNIDEHIASGNDPAAVSIELMPFVELADGTRLFDHNRVPAAFDNYVLGGSQLDLDSGEACAPVFGRVSFLGNWDEYRNGALRQDGYLVIDYHLGRLPTCRGTHNGYPAWDIVAHVKFAPGGQLVTGSVRELENHQGTPTNGAHTKPLDVKIPADATSAEIWFKNYTGAGSSCVAWDSNYGKNYRYPIWPAASDPRCKEIELWTTQHSDMPYASKPYCQAYTVDEDHAAKGCELYVSGIGDGYMGHYGIPNNWVEAYITAGPLDGKLLGAGMFTLYRDKKTNQIGHRVTFARQVDSATWQTGFIYFRPSIMSKGFTYAVEQMAFFVDVKRPSGKIVRLWQSRGGANYSWNDAFGAPTTKKYIAYGNIKYAGDGAGIFDVRDACEK
jgi:hypothetical protein